MPSKRWLDDVENDLKKNGVKCWVKITKDGDAWKLILKETRVLYGQQSQWIERERERERQTDRGRR